jgi:hypothetical protein
VLTAVYLLFLFFFHGYLALIRDNGIVGKFLIHGSSLMENSGCCGHVRVALFMAVACRKAVGDCCCVFGIKRWQLENFVVSYYR